MGFHALHGLVHGGKEDRNAELPKIKALWQIASHTHEKPVLLLGIFGGILMAALMTWLLVVMLSSPFTGQRFKRFLRGTKIVTVDKLKSLTRERKTQQVTVGDIPVPTAVEPTHILVAGSTGVGKSVVIRGLAYSGILRGDRFVFCDPNGDLVSKFYRQGDKI